MSAMEAGLQGEIVSQPSKKFGLHQDCRHSPEKQFRSAPD
jgi:hypothetical protein